MKKVNIYRLVKETVEVPSNIHYMRFSETEHELRASYLPPNSNPNFRSNDIDLPILRRLKNSNSGELLKGLTAPSFEYVVVHPSIKEFIKDFYKGE